MNELMRRCLAAGAGLDFAPRIDSPPLLRHHGDDDRVDRHRRSWRSSSSSSTASAATSQSTPLVLPSVKFEIAVIGVPLFFFLLWFVQGFKDYIWYTTPPKNTMDVYVMGEEVDVEVRLRGRRAQRDRHAARPGRPPGAAADDQPRRASTRSTSPTSASSRTCCPAATPRPGSRRPSRAATRSSAREYCGTWHSQMWGEVVVMPGPSSTRGWSSRRPASRSASTPAATTAADIRGSIVEYGKRVAMARGLPAAATRSTASRTSARPGWTSTSGARRWRTARRSIADEAYLTDSMIDPRGKVVKGFKPVMPTYKGRLAAPEAAALVEFIKSLRSTSLENLPSKEATYEPAKPSQLTQRSKPVYPAVNYLNADRGRLVVAAHARPQADRGHVPRVRCW